MINGCIVLAGTLLMLFNCIEFTRFRLKLKATLGETSSNFHRLAMTYQILVWLFFFGYLVTCLLMMIYGSEGGLIFLICTIFLAGSIFVCINLNFLKFMRDSIVHARLSETDSMTGLLNKVAGRKNIDEAFERETNPVYLAIVDLDNFKQVNDIYGHLAGDEVLKKTAEIIRNSIEADDIACRFGGDEFVLCLKNKKPEEVEALLTKMTEQICEIGTCYQRAHLSGSAGVSYGVGTCAGGCASYEDIMSQADKALYHVKHRGKCGYYIFSTAPSDGTENNGPANNAV